MPRSAFDSTLRSRVRRNLGRFERRAIPLGQRRRAAVCITLGPDAHGSPSFVLTRRAASLPQHSGQWALPGGRVEPGEDPVEAALRELDEEVGLRVDPAGVLGTLDDFATRSGYVITPFVVWEGEGAPLRPDPREVAAAYRIPVAELDPGEEGPVETRIPESDRPVMSLRYRDDLIHAPTAAMVWQAIEVAFRGVDTRVAHYEQPLFAWR